MAEVANATFARETWARYVKQGKLVAYLWIGWLWAIPVYAITTLIYLFVSTPIGLFLLFVWPSLTIGLVVLGKLEVYQPIYQYWFRCQHSECEKEIPASLQWICNSCGKMNVPDRPSGFVDALFKLYDKVPRTVLEGCECGDKPDVYQCPRCEKPLTLSSEAAKWDEHMLMKNVTVPVKVS